MRLCIFTSIKGNKVAINPEKIVFIGKHEDHTRILADGNVTLDVKEQIQTAMDKVIGGKRE